MLKTLFSPSNSTHLTQQNITLLKQVIVQATQWATSKPTQSYWLFRSIFKHFTVLDIRKEDLLILACEGLATWICSDEVSQSQAITLFEMAEKLVIQLKLDQQVIALGDCKLRLLKHYPMSNTTNVKKISTRSEQLDELTQRIKIYHAALRLKDTQQEKRTEESLQTYEQSLYDSLSQPYHIASETGYLAFERALRNDEANAYVAYQTFLMCVQAVATPCSLSYRTLLKDLRQQSQDKLEQGKITVPELTQRYTQGIQQLIQTFIKDCEALLGPAPLSFTLYTTGSAAREALHVKSDLEFAVLMEKDTPELRRYVETLLSLFEIKIVLLGETVLSNQSFVGDYIQEGFQIDSSMNPLIQEDDKNRPIYWQPLFSDTKDWQQYQNSYVFTLDKTGGCDFVWFPTVLTSLSLTKLPGQSSAAYVMTPSGMYYVEKNTKLLSMLTLGTAERKQLETHFSFDTLKLKNEPTQCLQATLSLEQQQFITTSSGHTRAMLHYIDDDHQAERLNLKFTQDWLLLAKEISTKKDFQSAEPLQAQLSSDAIKIAWSLITANPSHSRKYRWLINTPENLAFEILSRLNEKESEKEEHAWGLLYGRVFYGDTKLAQRYQQSIAPILQKSSLLEKRSHYVINGCLAKAEIAFPKKTKKFLLNESSKSYLKEGLLFPLQAVALCHGITTINTYKLLEELTQRKILPVFFSRCIENAYDKLQHLCLAELGDIELKTLSALPIETHQTMLFEGLLPVFHHWLRQWVQQKPFDLDELPSVWQISTKIVEEEITAYLSAVVFNQIPFPLLCQWYKKSHVCLHESFFEVTTKYQPKNRAMITHAYLAQYPKPNGERVILSTSTINEEWNNCLHSLVDKHLTSTITVQWPNTKIQALKSEVIKLILNKGEFVPNKINESQHDVHCLKSLGMHMKYRPGQPGVDIAFQLLSQLITGIHVPMTIARLKTNKIDEPLLISKTVSGDDLGFILHTDPKQLKELDRRSFSLQILLSLLANPGDDKPTNFILEKFTTWEGKEAYRLMNIDTHPFMPSVYQEGNTIKPAVKSILFLLKMMEDEIDSEAREEFLALDAEQVLEKWLTSLMELDKEFEVFKSIMPEWQKRSEEIRTTLPITLRTDEVTKEGIPKSGLIATLYQKMTRLQQYLHDKPKATHLQLLCFIEPTLGRCYLDAWADTTLKNPVERFHKLTKGQYAIIIKPLDEKNPNQKQVIFPTAKSQRDVQQELLGAIPTLGELFNTKKYGPTLALKRLKEIVTQTTQRQEKLVAIQQGDVKTIEDLAQWTSDDKQWLLANIDFSSLTSDMQKVLWSAFKGSYRQLCLKKWTLSDNELLTVLQLSPDLLSLDLRGCPNITGRTLENVSLYCKQIQKISLFDLEKLTYISTSWIGNPLVFNDLQFLTLQACNALMTVRLDTPKLLEIKIRSKKLSEVKTNSQCLEWLEIKEAKYLTNNMLKTIGNLAKLKYLDVSQSEIETLEIEAFALHTFIAENCTLLKGLHIASDECLTKINIVGCNVLPDANELLKYPFLLLFPLVMRTSNFFNKLDNFVVKPLGNLKEQNPIIIKMIAVKVKQWLTSNSLYKKQFIKLLQDKDWKVRQYSIENLRKVSEGNNEGIIKILLNILMSDEKWQVREAAAKILGLLDHQDKKVIEALLKALVDLNLYVRDAAMSSLDGLANKGNLDAIQGLFITIKNWDMDIRIKSIKILSGLNLELQKRNNLVAILLNNLNNENEEVLKVIITQLVYYLEPKDQKVIKALIKILNTTNNEGIQELIIKGWIDIGLANNQYVINAILKLLSKKLSEEIVDVALIVLKKSGKGQDLNVIETLFYFLYDKDKHICEVAMHALIELSKEKNSIVVDFLLEKLKKSPKNYWYTLDIVSRLLIQLGQENNSTLINIWLEILTKSSNYSLVENIEILNKLKHADIKMTTEILNIVSSRIKFLYSNDEDVCLNAISFLCRVQHDNNVKVTIALLEILKKTHEKFCTKVMSMLGELGYHANEIAIDILLQMFEDNVKVKHRANIVYYLTRIGQAKNSILQKKLTETLKQKKDWKILKAVADIFISLKWNNEPIIMAVWLESLKKNENWFPLKLIENIGNLNQQVSSEIFLGLLDAIKYGDNKIRETAINVITQLGKTKNSELIEILLKALDKTQQWNFRKTVVEILVLMNEESQPLVIEACLEGLDNEKGWFPLPVIKSLGQLKKIVDSTVVNGLLRCLNSGNDEICRVAANSLIELKQSEKLAKILLELLRNKQSDAVNKMMIRILSGLGKLENKIAITMWRDLLKKDYKWSYHKSIIEKLDKAGQKIDENIVAGLLDALKIETTASSAFHCLVRLGQTGNSVVIETLLHALMTCQYWKFRKNILEILLCLEVGYNPIIMEAWFQILKKSDDSKIIEILLNMLEKEKNLKVCKTISHILLSLELNNESRINDVINKLSQDETWEIQKNIAKLQDVLEDDIKQNMAVVLIEIAKKEKYANNYIPTIKILRQLKHVDDSILIEILLDKLKKERLWINQENVSKTLVKFCPNGGKLIVNALLDLLKDNRKDFEQEFSLFSLEFKGAGQIEMHLGVVECLTQLGQKNNTDAINALFEALNKVENWKVQKKIINSLTLLECKDKQNVINALLQILKNQKNWKVRIMIINALSFLGKNAEQKVLIVLLGAMKDENKLVCFVAILTLVRLGQANNLNAIKILVEHVKNEFYWRKYLTTIEILNEKDPKSYLDVIEVLFNPEKKFRKYDNVRTILKKLVYFDLEVSHLEFFLQQVIENSPPITEMISEIFSVDELFKNLAMIITKFDKIPHAAIEIEKNLKMMILNQSIETQKEVTLKSLNCEISHQENTVKPNLEIEKLLVEVKVVGNGLMHGALFATKHMKQQTQEALLLEENSSNLRL